MLTGRSLNLFANTVRSHLEKEKELAAQGKDEIYDTLDLDNNAVTFSVVTIDSDVRFVVPEHLDRYDIHGLEQYQDYIAVHQEEEVSVSVEYLMLGDMDIETESALSDEADFIEKHLDEVLNYKYTTSLEYEEYTVKTPDEMLESKQEEIQLEKAKKYIGSYLESEFLSENISFNTTWLKDKENNLKPTTYRRYIQLLNRIIPAIGHLKIGQIQPYHLRAFFDDLGEERREDAKYLPNGEARRLSQTETRPELAKHTGISTTTVDCIRAGKKISRETALKYAEYFDRPLSKLFDAENVTLSSRTVLHHYRLIFAILHDAVYDQIITANPCQRIRPPKVEDKEARYKVLPPTEPLLQDTPLQGRAL